MKATLDRLLKESTEKDAQIKRQNKQITNLTNKLGKASNEHSAGEDSNKDSYHNKESHDEFKLKKDRSSSLMSVEQI